MDASMITDMKVMEDENRRLKMYAELSMQNELLKEALGKKLKRIKNSALHRPVNCQQ